MAAFVGIDPSYSGFAVALLREVPGEERLHHFVTRFDFSPKKAGTGITRLRFIHGTLRNHFFLLNSTYGVERVCLEGYAPNSKFNRETLGELGGVARLALSDALPVHKIHVVAPTALKKFVTGSGTSGKDVVILHTYKKWDVEFSNNDEADAYGLARIAHGISRGVDLAYQSQVIIGLRAAEKLT